MGTRTKRLNFGTEGWERLQGREEDLFPWPVRSRVRRLLWVAIAMLALALTLIAVLAGQSGIVSATAATRGS
jgi:hypothetical protein